MHKSGTRASGLKRTLSMGAAAIRGSSGHLSSNLTSIASFFSHKHLFVSFVFLETVTIVHRDVMCCTTLFVLIWSMYIRVSKATNN